MLREIYFISVLQIYANAGRLRQDVIENDGTNSGSASLAASYWDGSSAAVLEHFRTTNIENFLTGNVEKKSPVVKLTKAPRNTLDEAQELVCEATGEPTPSIKWSMNGKFVQSDDKNVREIHANNETISIITLEDSNVTVIYICTASNEYGTSDAQIEVILEEDLKQMVIQENGFQEMDFRNNAAKIENDSMVLSNLQWTSNSNGDVTLFWEVPKTTTKHMTYKVYFTENELLPLEEWRQMNAEQEELKILSKDLAANTTYYARIAVIQQNYISEPIAFSTPDIGPSGPPEKIQIEKDEAGVVVISWKKPQHINGDLEKYTLYFTRDPDIEDEKYREWPSINILTSANEYSYKMDEKVGLKPRSVYRVRITASNNVAESKPSDVYEFETSARVNPVPTDVHVEVNNENEVVLRFNAVKNPEDHNAYIREYDVLISTSLDVFVAQFIPVEATITNFDEENGRITMKIPSSELSSNTRYWLKVEAHVPGRDVQSSKPKRFQTGAGGITTKTT